MIESKTRGVLDTPLEPVIGLAEGETWRLGMTLKQVPRNDRTTPCLSRPYAAAPTTDGLF